jgi:hypothetical protein
MLVALPLLLVSRMALAGTDINAKPNMRLASPAVPIRRMPR